MNLNLTAINTGQAANDGYGDPLRKAFSISHTNDILLESGVAVLSGYLESVKLALDNRITSEVSLINNRIDLEVSSLSGQIISSGNFLEEKINQLSGA